MDDRTRSGAAQSRHSAVVPVYRYRYSTVSLARSIQSAVSLALLVLINQHVTCGRLRRRMMWS